VHFNGFDPLRPWLLSTDVTRPPPRPALEHPLLAELCTITATSWFARLGQDRGEYGFGQLADGTILRAPARRSTGAPLLRPSVPASCRPAPGSRRPGRVRRLGRDEGDRPAQLTDGPMPVWQDDPALRGQFASRSAPTARRSANGGAAPVSRAAGAT